MTRLRFRRLRALSGVIETLGWMIWWALRMYVRGCRWLVRLMWEMVTEHSQARYRGMQQVSRTKHSMKQLYADVDALIEADRVAAENEQWRKRAGLDKASARRRAQYVAVRGADGRHGHFEVAEGGGPILTGPDFRWRPESHDPVTVDGDRLDSDTGGRVARRTGSQPGTRGSIPRPVNSTQEVES